MQAVQPIPCRITLRHTDAATLYGIISPRTGRRLEVAREYLADAPRIAGRIVQAVSPRHGGPIHPRRASGVR